MSGGGIPTRPEKEGGGSSRSVPTEETQPADWVQLPAWAVLQNADGALVARAAVVEALQLTEEISTRVGQLVGCVRPASEADLEPVPDDIVARRLVGPWVSTDPVANRYENLSFGVVR